MHILRAEMRRFHRRPSFFICRNHNIRSNKWRGAKPWSKQLKKMQLKWKTKASATSEKPTTLSSCVALTISVHVFGWSTVKPPWMHVSGRVINPLCECLHGGDFQREQTCDVWRRDQWHPTCCCCCHRTCLITGFDSAHRWAASWPSLLLTATHNLSVPDDPYFCLSALSFILLSVCCLSFYPFVLCTLSVSCINLSSVRSVILSATILSYRLYGGHSVSLYLWIYLLFCYSTWDYLSVCTYIVLSLSVCLSVRRYCSVIVSVYRIYLTVFLFLYLRLSPCLILSVLLFCTVKIFKNLIKLHY